MALSTRALRKQEQIFDAAEQLFLRLGLRGATMAGLAKEAGVAKPTLYGYFPDKEAVFLGVLARFNTRLEQAVTQCLHQDTPTSNKVSDALVEKSRMVHRLLQGSPHADELLAGKKKLYQDRSDQPDQWVVDLLVPVMRSEHGDRAAPLATLLVSCAHGLVDRAQSEDELEEGIRTVVTSVLAQDLS